MQFDQEHVAQQLLCPRPATHWQHHRAEGRAEVVVLQPPHLGNDEFLHYVIRFVWEPLNLICSICEILTLVEGISIGMPLAASDKN